MFSPRIERIHPHDLWRQTHRLTNDRRPTKKWVAEQLEISSGHLSSIYKGDFRPSEELAERMAILTDGRCSARDILQWHRKNPPVWETGRARALPQRKNTDEAISAARR
jgi:hypothetical protein